MFNIIAIVKGRRIVLRTLDTDTDLVSWINYYRHVGYTNVFHSTTITK